MGGCWSFTNKTTFVNRHSQANCICNIYKAMEAPNVAVVNAAEDDLRLMEAGSMPEKRIVDTTRKIYKRHIQFIERFCQVR